MNTRHFVGAVLFLAMLGLSVSTTYKSWIEPDLVEQDSTYGSKDYPNYKQADSLLGMEARGTKEWVNIAKKTKQ